MKKMKNKKQLQQLIKILINKLLHYNSKLHINKRLRNEIIFLKYIVIHQYYFNNAPIYD